MAQMNLFTKQKYSHRCEKQTYGYRGGGINWEIEIDICIHTTTYKIDKGLLYSTGSSMQYSIMTYMKNLKKSGCMCN